jgi:lysine 2,3-aminomutase
LSGAKPRPDDLAQLAQRYAVAITPIMQDLIDAHAPHDPIAAQFSPDAREWLSAPHESADPIGDHTHSPVKGIVHRYRDRVLLKIVHACPVYCRFCFRREMIGPGGEGGLTADELDAALAYIAGDPQIWEVVLTGGDPFILSPRRIRALMARLDEIAHVKVVRWHTRVPLVDPTHITEPFVTALRSGAKAVWVALHANHPREFTAQGRAAIARLVDAGIAMVSQSVLLAGVNDDAETLEALMRAFVENRVKPYYLHHLDTAPGVEHFRTSIAAGQALMQSLHAAASGLCQPTYVLDIPGGVCKARLSPCDAQPTASGWTITDDQGRTHDYQI